MDFVFLTWCSIVTFYYRFKKWSNSRMWRVFARAGAFQIAYLFFTPYVDWLIIIRFLRMTNSDMSWHGANGRSLFMRLSGRLIYKTSHTSDFSEKNRNSFESLKERSPWDKRARFKNDVLWHVTYFLAAFWPMVCHFYASSPLVAILGTSSC